MRLYHGTTLKSAESIRKEGLKPEPKLAFDTERDFFFGSSHLRENDGSVYLSKKKKFAADMARFRVAYDATPVNERVKGFPTFTRVAAGEITKETPAVITFDIPENAVKLYEDEQALGVGLKCDCVIPPEYVVSVQEVPYDTTRRP